MGGAGSVPANGASDQAAGKIDELQRQLDAAKAELARLQESVGASPGTETGLIAAKMSVSDKGAGQKGNLRREEVSADVLKKGDKAGEYKKIVIPKSEDVKNVLKKAVDANILFKGLRDEEKTDCVDAFYCVNLAAGDNAIVQYEAGDKFFVVESGQLDVLVAPDKSAAAVKYGQLADGDSFGELALMYSKPRAATIKATEPCVLWAINRTDYRAIHIHHKTLRKHVFEDYLRKVPDLAHLKPQEISRMADAVDEEEFEEGSAIIREGAIGDVFYIIEWGTVEYQRKDEGVVGTGGPGDYFGHKALLTEEKRAATVIAKSKVGCLTMSRNDFVQLLGSLKDIKNRHSGGTTASGAPPAAEGDAQAAGKGGASAQAAADEGTKYLKDIRFEDLQRKFPHKNNGASTQKNGAMHEIVLGQGAFGKVQIVKHIHTGETYALKALNKSQIVDNSLEAHVVDERKVMTMIDHPFLLKLYNSYWDSKYVYLLLELCLGGELFTMLRKYGRFEEKATKFYSSIVLQAFGHLHSKDIVYRDLKPENLMLDDKGYIKVVDFGLAKVVKDRTWTLCGTPDYLAPEIILSKGHDRAVDYWALGVLTYECLAGYVPFYAEDPMDVYQLILDGELKFPTHFSRACCDLIRKLLTSCQTKRLGNTKEGIQAIVKHRWFSGYDWEGLSNRSLVPPITITVKSPEDTSNFDEYPTELERVQDCNWVPPFPHEFKDGKTIGL
jgi:CRP-like cAMP-binding protein/tRNA A-37 threonylcarbamoyl transferase component Bud32